MSNRTNLLLADVASWLLFAVAVAILIGIALEKIAITPGVVAAVGVVFLAALCGSAQRRYRAMVKTERLAEIEKRLREEARA